jgi:IS30 family transposase
MAKPRNNGKRWTKTEDNEIKTLAKRGVDTDKIAKELERTTNAVEEEAYRKKISLEPKDKKNVH